MDPDAQGRPRGPVTGNDGRMKVVVTQERREAARTVASLEANGNRHETASDDRRRAAADEPASPRLFLAVVTSAVVVTTLTGSMLNVLIPLMRAEFGASVAQIGWIVTGYALAYAVGVPLYGKISDVFGVRRVFSLGLLGFAAGGLICALAPSLPVLVLGRTVQGIGGAAVPALASVTVAKVLPPGRRGGALGLVAASVGVGSTLGPIIGGAVGQLAGWRLLFVGSLVLMLLVIPFAQRVLPNGGADRPGRFDLLGGVLLGLAAGLFLFGITRGQAFGFDSPSAWGSFLGAAVAAAGFVQRINLVADPFVSPALFRNRAYVAALLVGFCAMLANLAALVVAPLLLVEVNRLSPGAAGLALTPAAIAVALLAPVAGRLSDRVGARTLILIGLGLMALSTFFLSGFAAGAPAALVSLGMLGLGCGSAFIQSPASNAAANALPASAIGAGMGIFSGAFFLGGGTGAALIGAFLAARQEAATEAINPLYRLTAAPFSDAFLAMTAVLVLGSVTALGLRGRNAKNPT